jgi:c-di-GMP phosphodiesterase
VSWLKRWFSPAPAAASKPADVDADAALRLPESSAATAAPVLPKGTVQVPLIQPDGRLAGFQFHLPTLLKQRLGQSGEAGSPALRAHFEALAAAMQAVLADGRVALLAWPREVPMATALAAPWPAKLWLAVPGDALAAQDWSALRALGVQVGCTQVPQRGASFVHIDASGIAAAQLAAAVAACKRAAPQARVVMGHLEDLESVEAALAAGADLAAGEFGRLGQAPVKTSLPPAASRVSRLLGQLLQEAPLADIAAQLRTDVALSLHLLQHANSPLMGLNRQVQEVEQAVLLLGRDQVYRWLCARLVAAVPARATARALQEVALARAFLFEQLAPPLAATPSALYTFGLLSMLDLMVPMPLAQAVAELPLTEPAREALIQRSGPWAALLPMAACLERGDLQGATPLAQALGGIESVQAMHVQAWTAAREAGGSLW